MRWRGQARASRGARYCCDPVIGDVGRGVFVPAGIAEFMRERAVPAADVVTPNHFELDSSDRPRRPTASPTCSAAVDGLARARAARRAGHLAR